MSEVALPIGGRTYRVACAAGEEERVARLGAAVSDKLAAMGNLSGHEAQNLLFAALLLADEVHEGRDTVAKAGDEIAAARREADSAANEGARLRDTIAELESELSGLQGAEQGAAADLAAAQGRLAEFSERIAEQRAAEQDLLAQIGQLRREREETAGPGPALEGGNKAVELAPALERLAEMLEDCADKLESAAPNA